MMDAILTGDIGTTEVKVCLFSLDGQLLALESVGHATHRRMGNEAEQDPHDWLRGFICAAQRVLSASSDTVCVIGIGLTGQMAACLGVDEQGEPTHPALTWADQRAAQDGAHLATTLGSALVYRLTGNPISPMYLSAKAAWLKRERPSAYARTHVFFQAQDYIAYHLTGAVATDYSNASCTGLFDLAQRRWSSDIADAMDIAVDKLPPVVPAATCVGELRADMASTIGLPAGLPVILGGGDGPSTAVGAGAVGDGDGYIYIGSSAWLAFTARTAFRHHDRGIVSFLHLDPDLYTHTGSMQAAGTALDWSAQTLLTPALGAEIYSQLNEQAATPSIHGDLLFLPYLLGERTPYWDPSARGAFIGLTPQHTAVDMCRSVFEGVALHLRVIGDVFAGEHLRLPVVPLVGGGVRLPHLCQVIANAFDTPVAELPTRVDATSRGAFVAAAVALGLQPNFATARVAVDGYSNLWQPNPDHASRLAALLPLFREAYEGLQPVFARLASLRPAL